MTSVLEILQRWQQPVCEDVALSSKLLEVLCTCEMWDVLETSSSTCVQSLSSHARQMLLASSKTVEGRWLWQLHQAAQGEHLSSYHSFMAPCQHPQKVAITDSITPNQVPDFASCLFIFLFNIYKTVLLDKCREIAWTIENGLCCFFHLSWNENRVSGVPGEERRSWQERRKDS